MVDVSQIVPRLNAAEAEANLALVERSTTIRMILLSILAQTHLLLFGERGIAKTMVADVIHSHMDSAVRKFYLQCSKSMPPDLLVGPLSLKLYVEKDEIGYNITGKMADSHMVILDEVFKTNAIALNITLGIINERRFVTNGHVHECPLWTVIGTSNLEESQITPELEPFRDRFACALLERPVTSEPGFRAILAGQIDRFSHKVKVPEAQTILTHDEIVTLQDATREVTHPAEVIDALVDLRTKADAEGLRPSARRFGQLMQLMAAQAIVNLRTTTRTSDVTLAQHVLWTDPQDAPKAYELIVDCAGPSVSKAHAIGKTLEPVLEELHEIAANVDPNLGRPADSEIGRIIQIRKNLTVTKDELAKVMASAQGSGEDMAELLTTERELQRAQGMTDAFLGI